MRFYNSSGSNIFYTIRMYMDSTIIVSYGPIVNTGTNYPHIIEAEWLFTASGSSGGWVPTYRHWYYNSNLVASPAINPTAASVIAADHLDVQTIDTTASHTIKVTIQMATASATAQWDVHSAQIEQWL